MGVGAYVLKILKYVGESVIMLKGDGVGSSVLISDGAGVGGRVLLAPFGITVISGVGAGVSSGIDMIVGGRVSLGTLKVDGKGVGLAYMHTSMYLQRPLERDPRATLASQQLDAEL